MTHTDVPPQLDHTVLSNSDDGTNPTLAPSTALPHRGGIFSPQDPNAPDELEQEGGIAFDMGAFWFEG